MADRSVLLVLGPSAGGVRRHVATLRDELRERGWAVTVAGPPAVLDGLGGTDHPLPGFSSVDVPRTAAAIRRAAAGVDVVHVHGLKAGLCTVLSGVRPRLFTIHNVVLEESAGPSTRLLRAVERRLPTLMDRTIAVSAEIAGRFHGAATRDMVVIPPASPMPERRRSADEVRRDLGVGDAPLVVTAARLAPQKDVPTLLAAARTVIDRRPEVRFVVLGGGPAEDEVRAEHRRLDLGGAVQLLGQRPSAIDELAAADVVALSSIWEGSPLVVAEALLLGRPVVATAVGAVPEVVVDGETGRLVPPGSPDALAAAIIDLVDDPSLAQDLAAAGHRVAVERFSTAALVAAVEREYLAVLP